MTQQVYSRSETDTTASVVRDTTVSTVIEATGVVRETISH